MPSIIIRADRVRLSRPRIEATIVTLSEIDGIYAVACTGDGVDQCPEDLEDGDTWSSFEACIQDAVSHIHNHEQRFCERCGSDVLSVGLVVDGEQRVACRECGHVEVRS